MGNIYTTGPNEALVISGGLCGSTQKTMVYGGWAWAWCCLSDVQSISLEVMTLKPKCEKVETAKGVPLTVTGVAQVKVMTERQLLITACEQFIGRPVEHVEMVILQTLEGHLRAILGTLSVEAIYQDRDQFAQLVREVAAPDLGRMGMEILSFTIKDVVDEVDYLNSLGRAQVALVKRDAQIGVAEANRDAGIKEAEFNRNAMDIKYQTDSKIANANREFQMQQAAFDMEVNTKKADAELAYELQAARQKQKIRQEEIQIDVVERHKQIAIEEKEIMRKEKELYSLVRLPAEAEAYRIEQIAEGTRNQKIERAHADAERVKMIGKAEAMALEAVGKAEAEQMRMRAAAYKEYGNSAVMAQVLTALPKIAAEVAAPLAKTKEVVIIGGDDRTTAEIARLAASLPPAVKGLTGVDLTTIMGKMVSTAK